MIHSILLVLIAILCLLSIWALRKYNKRYGYPFWRDLSLSEKNVNKVPLIHTTFNQVYLSQANKKILLSLYQQGCRKFLVFRVGVFDNSYLIITENADKKIWVTVFITDDLSYCALTGIYLKDNEKKIITVSNAPNYRNELPTKHTRTNYKTLDAEGLFRHLDKCLPLNRRQKTSLRYYMRLSKKLFLDELLQIYQTNREKKQLEVPGSLFQPHQKLITRFAKENNISSHFLKKNSRKILLVNNNVSPDYLVANIVTASKDLYDKRKMILANLIAAEDANQWFKDINNSICEANRFHYLGTLKDAASSTDFYYHQHITLRFQ